MPPPNQTPPAGVVGGDQPPNHFDNRPDRKRVTIDSGAYGGGLACAAKVRAGLDTLRAQDNYEEAATRDVLVRAGLDRPLVISITEYDPNATGWYISGWTGAACVYGEHRPERSIVEVAGITQEGACLSLPRRS